MDHVEVLHIIDMVTIEARSRAFLGLDQILYASQARNILKNPRQPVRLVDLRSSADQPRLGAVFGFSLQQMQRANRRSSILSTGSVLTERIKLRESLK